MCCVHTRVHACLQGCVCAYVGDGVVGEEVRDQCVFSCFIKMSPPRKTLSTWSQNTTCKERIEASSLPGRKLVRDAHLSTRPAAAVHPIAVHAGTLDGNYGRFFLQLCPTVIQEGF